MINNKEFIIKFSINQRILGNTFVTNLRTANDIVQKLYGALSPLICHRHDTFMRKSCVVQLQFRCISQIDQITVDTKMKLILYFRFLYNLLHTFYISKNSHFMCIHNSRNI